MFFPISKSFLFQQCRIILSKSRKDKYFLACSLHSKLENRPFTSSDAYLFGDKPVTFNQLGVMPSLCNALASCGKNHATLIQLHSFPKVIAGNDVIIASETGSGKTYAYLIPLIQKCLEYKNNLKYLSPSVIILIPNKELSNQILSVSRNLTNLVNDQIVIDSLPSGTEGSRWFTTSDGDKIVDILLCTPARLLNHIRKLHTEDLAVLLNVKHLVIDEADMLLDGSYLKDTERVIGALATARRKSAGISVRWDHVSRRFVPHSPSEAPVQRYQTVLCAASVPTCGDKAVANYLQDKFPQAVRVTLPMEHSRLHAFHPRVQQRFLKLDCAASDEGAWSRQHVLAVLEAVRCGDLLPAAAHKTQTMIFANTANRAAELAKALQSEQLSCLPYHSSLPSSARHRNLQEFRAGLCPALVCTDSLARGVDLPAVRHVVQADFALDAVSFLHRTGRAARAGHEGYATHFYGASAESLVQSLLAAAGGSDAAEGFAVRGGGVEQSFSRRRRFRKKLRRAALRED